jgi:ABC-type nitrate/sulfonate/bicarbonate transport system substrate-binding protein
LRLSCTTSASGGFEKLGVNVKVEVGRGAGQAIQLVAAKQVEAGRTGGANYLAARAQDNSDVLAFGTVSQISPFVVISSESHPVRDVNALAGKVVGRGVIWRFYGGHLEFDAGQSGCGPQIGAS